MSSYPVPPPSYTAPKNYHAAESREHLLPGSSSGGGIYNQPNVGEVPDDFKVKTTVNPLNFISDTTLQYGVTVSESSPEIRSAFIRKVYTILCVSHLVVLGYIIYIPFCSMPNREPFLHYSPMIPFFLLRLPLPLLVV
jgi:hypothetical protein